MHTKMCGGMCRQVEVVGGEWWCWVGAGWVVYGWVILRGWGGDIRWTGGW